MKLLEIGIGNFRSIGSEPVWINLGKKLNVFIGANNSGKSNVLRAIEWLTENRSLNKKLDQIEQHQRDAKKLIRFTLKAKFEDSDEFSLSEDNTFIIDVHINGMEREWIKGPLDDIDFKKINKSMKKYLGKYYNSHPGQEQLIETTHKIYERLTSFLIAQLPEIFFIPQFRQITPGQNYSIKGDGIVEMLASWQHPEITMDSNTERFLKIQELLRRLLNMPSIEMEVVHTKDQIIVKNGELRLPLESYGTGVHELIILAAAIYSQDNALFCIEEPEIHLHPKLQKEFIRFLINETNNKYLITTHSNAFISPSDDVEVVHVRTTNDSTTGRRIESSYHTLELLNDLGIQASDILQANSVIWVEGPSDRVYMNKWLKLLAPDLQEGVDYSIMFYGGRLLSHISLEREMFPSPDDLIPLLRINQKPIIVVDSDRKAHYGRISETKNRIRKECEDNKIYCWITDGREIENYIPGHTVSKTYTEKTGIEKEIAINKYDELENVLKNAYKTNWKNSWSYNSAKPAMARKIANHVEEQDISLDLKKHLDKIIKIIRSA